VLVCVDGNRTHNLASTMTNTTNTTNTMTGVDPPSLEAHMDLDLARLTEQLAEAVDFDAVLAVAARWAASFLGGGLAVAAAYEPGLARWYVQAAGEPAPRAAALAAQLHGRLPALSEARGEPDRLATVAGEGATVVEVQLPHVQGPAGLLGIVLPSASPRPEGQTWAAALKRNLAIIGGQVVLALQSIGNAARVAALERQQQEHHEFLSLTAHDLRTPLAAIRGYAQLLLRRTHVDEPPLQRAGLETIIQQTDRLTALTDMLLDVARIQTRRMAMRRVTADVGQVVRQAVARLKDRSDTTRIEIVGPETGPVLLVDVSRLAQITEGLLAFAIERTPQGGSVTLQITPTAAGVQLAVVDGGPALGAEERLRLFDQLVAISSHGTGRALGHIGLYIARGVAEAHGGWARAESPAPGREAGARLVVWLPAVATAATGTAGGS
jgi:K+-sensing histidine kinase KdpD